MFTREAHKALGNPGVFLPFPLHKKKQRCTELRRFFGLSFLDL